MSIIYTLPIYHRRSTDSPPTINVQRISRVPAAILAEISADSRRYADHHSADISVDTSVDMSTDTSRSTYRPTLDRYVDRHIGRHSADMSTNTSVECRSICRPRCRPICRPICWSRGAQNTHDPTNVNVGGTVASRLVCSTLERVVRVRALAGDIVLCSWARHFTLTVPLSTQVYKWVPANCWGKPNKLLGSDLRWTSIPSRGSRNTSSGFMLQKLG